MERAKMLREQAAATGRDRAAESGGRGDVGFALSARLRVSERIGEVLDRRLDDAFEVCAIVAHLLVDVGSRRLRQISVLCRFPADRHQWMGGEFAELVPT